MASANNKWTLSNRHLIHPVSFPTSSPLTRLDSLRLRKAFEKVQELYSSEFLSHIADVKKILDALGKHKTACASIPSLGDHINRCLVDILDYLNLSIGQAKNSELVHLNEIVESCVELMSVRSWPCVESYLFRLQTDR